MTDKLGPIEIKFLLDKETEKRAVDLKEAIDEVGSSREKAGKIFHDLSQESKNQFSSTQRYLKQERGLIAEIEEALKELREMKRNAFSPEEIEKLNKKIAEAKHELRQFNEAGLNTANVQDKVTQKTGVLSTDFGRLLTASLLVTGAIKGFRSIMESTESTMVAMKSSIYGLRTALEALEKTIATGNWKNFRDLFSGGFWDVFQSGKRYKEQMSVLESVRRDYALKAMDLDKTIEEQRRIIYEDESVSRNMKLKAYDEMLNAMSQKADLEIEIARRTNRAIIDLTKDKNKISEEDLNYVLTNYDAIQQTGRNYDVIEKQIRKMEKALHRGMSLIPGSLDSDAFKNGEYKINVFVDTKVSENNLAKLKELRDALGPDASVYADKLKKYEALTKEEQDLLYQSVVNIKEANNQYNVESRRAYIMQQNMINSENRELKKHANELKKIKDEITTGNLKGKEKELKELKLKYEKDIEAYSDNEEMKAALTERYGQMRYDVELKYLLLLKDQYIKVAEALEKLRSGGELSSRAIWSRSYKNPFVATFTDIYKIRPTNQSGEKIEEKVTENLEKQKKQREQILSLAIDLAETLAHQIGLSEDERNAFDSWLNSVKSGNMLGFIATYFSYIIKIFNKSGQAAEEAEAKLRGLYLLIERSSKLLRHAEGWQQAEAYQNKIDLLLKAIAAAEAQAEMIIKDFEKQGKRRMPDSMRQRIINDLTFDLKLELESIKKEYNEFLRGGITSNTIADAIRQGFEEGKTSLDDFAGHMKNVLFDAVKEVFMAKIIADPMLDNLLNYISERMGDGFSPDEINYINSMLEQISREYKPLWDNLTKFYNAEGVSDESGLSGSIKGVSEETASVVAGQMNSMRIAQTEMLSTMKQQLLSLNEIASNTKYTIYLESIDKKLDLLKSDPLRAQGVTA